jgi:hypothetical protein
MLNTEISLDNTYNPPPPVVVFPQPTASDAAQANSVNLPEHAFRICFKAHQTVHILPYLDCTGRGDPADKVMVSLGVNHNRYDRGAKGVNAGAGADTLVPTADVTAGTNWDLAVETGSDPRQWPVGYKEPPAPPLQVTRTDGGTRRYICKMAARYGKRRPAAQCAVCNRQEHKILEETQASKQLCDQFATQYRAAWQNHIQLSALNDQVKSHTQAMQRMVAKAQTPKASRKRDDAQTVDAAVTAALQALGPVCISLAALQPNVPNIIPVNLPNPPARQNDAPSVIDDPQYVVAVETYVRSISAITAAVPIPRRFMIGVLICTLDDHSTRTYLAISNDADLQIPVNAAKENLAVHTAGQIAGATYAAHRGNAQPLDWAGRNNLNVQRQGSSNPPGNCAAPKLLQRLYADNVQTRVTQFEMTEQWFDPKDQDPWRGLTEPSCETCQVQVPTMLCGSQ